MFEKVIGKKVNKLIKKFEPINYEEPRGMIEVQKKNIKK